MGNALNKRPKWVRNSEKKLAPYLITVVAWCVIKSCRVERVIGSKNIDDLLSEKVTILPCYWHQQTLFCVHFLLGFMRRGLNLGFLVSPSKDGEIGAKIFKFWGAKVLRGSSSATGAQALRDIYLAVSRENLSVATTPDGPRGPAFEFKQGWVTLAKLTGKPILPVAYAANKAWRLNTWDKLIIPKPFARVVIAVGEPTYVAKDLDTHDLEQVQHKMEDELNALSAVARTELLTV